MKVDFAYINQFIPRTMLAIARKIVAGDAELSDAEQLYEQATLLAALIDPDVGEFQECSRVSAAFEQTRAALEGAA